MTKNNQVVEKEIKFVIGQPLSKSVSYAQKDLEIGTKLEVTPLNEDTKNLTVLSEGERVANVANMKFLARLSLNEELVPSEEISNYLDTLKEVTIVEKIDKNIGNMMLFIVGGTIEVQVKKIMEEKNADLDLMIENALSVLSKEEIEERISYLESVGVTNKVIANLLSKIRPIEKYEGLENYIPTKPSTLYKDENGFVRQSLIFSLKGNNLLYQGEKAVGKNVLAATIAWLYRRPIVTVSLNNNNSLSDLVGDKTMKDGNIEFELELIPRIAQVGGIVVLDELNTADPGLLTALHSLLDKQRQIQVTSYGLIKADEDFFVIGTQNPDYMGTSENNQATKSRFVSFNFAELQDITEVLKSEVPNAESLVLNRMQLLYSRLRVMVKDGVVTDDVINLRSMIAALEVVTEYDEPLKNALERAVIDQTTDEYERQALEELIVGLLG